MTSSEKIDFLMKLTDTSNSTLAKAINFDASYVSRIRTGKRNLPKPQLFAEPASAFFAERIDDGYKKRMAADIITPGREWPENTRLVQKLIYNWISADKRAGDLPVDSFLSGISGVREEHNVLKYDEFKDEFSLSGDDTVFFYGNEGKRKAVEIFLYELGEMENPPQLLLYSNEDFSWMYEDASFNKKWAALIIRYIKKGGKIKIAHTVSRASGEMLMGLKKWVPLYMTGAIEPYYYPKTLDRVFRKTLFIADGYSAIAASSVGEKTDNAINCLIHDKNAVNALEDEYWSFFEMCRPLVKIFNMSNRDDFFKILKDFNFSDESMITARTTPSFYTMPKEVAESMLERTENSWIRKRQRYANEAFEEMMAAGSSLTEILNLPKAEDVVKGNVAFPMCDIFDKPGLFYTPEEFKLHIDSVIEKLRENENYNVVLSSAIPDNEIVYVKDSFETILVKNDVPSAAFVIDEQRMIAAFWEYLSLIKEKGKSKDKTLAELEKLRDSLNEQI